jgi:hypothetical protein
MKQAFVIQILVDPILKDAANQMRYGRLGQFFSRTQESVSLTLMVAAEGGVELLLEADSNKHGEIKIWLLISDPTGAP